MKRIFLFLMTNIAVMVVISVVLNLLNLNGALAMRNGDMMGLLAALAVIGFTGSIISLLMSKTMAKMSVGAQVIKQPSSEVEQWLAIKRAASDVLLENKGTISHHHGVGLDHAPWLAEEKGPIGFELLKTIKADMDPAGIMNPGKLLG